MALKLGPGWFRTAMRDIFGTLVTQDGAVAKAANVADAAALTSIDLDPAVGTPDAEGDLADVTDGVQDTNNATIAAQFNALRADVVELHAQFNALLAALEAAGMSADS